jgi:hypothetical protein
LEGFLFLYKKVRYFSSHDIMMQPFESPFAKVHLDRTRKRLEIEWLGDPANKDYSFMMAMVQRLMDKHQIQYLIQHKA